VKDVTVVDVDWGSKTAGKGRSRLATPGLAAMAEQGRERFTAKWSAQAHA